MKAIREDVAALGEKAAALAAHQPPAAPPQPAPAAAPQPKPEPEWSGAVMATIGNFAARDESRVGRIARRFLRARQGDGPPLTAAEDAEVHLVADAISKSYDKLRKGEALALKWSAIDFERGTLAVRLALQRVKMPGEKKGQLILREPKRSSRRTINLPQVCVSALLQHRAMQEQERRLAGTRWKESDYVFTTGIGTPLEPRNLERAYSQILAIAGLHHIRIHDLRRTAATLLLTQGVHPRLVMELLGHSQISVTMNTYSHVVPALRKEAANQMDRILNPNGVATKPASPGLN